MSQEYITLQKPGVGIMNDRDLIGNPDMIRPFQRVLTRWGDGGKKKISYGLSSMGYDVSMGRDYKLFTPEGFFAKWRRRLRRWVGLSPKDGDVIDPHNLSNDYFVEYKDVDYIDIPPGGYLLGHTKETFDMPDDVLAVCFGKSTYARIGAVVNVTPIEPGFKGQVVIEITNGTERPIRIYSDEGVSQFIFLRANSPCLTTYASRGGKYQNQSGVQGALV
jgi:dCTP deaminase